MKNLFLFFVITAIIHILAKNIFYDICAIYFLIIINYKFSDKILSLKNNFVKDFSHKVKKIKGK